MLHKTKFLFFSIFFIQACWSMDNRNAIVLSPEPNKKFSPPNRSNSFQNVIQNILTNKNESNKKYKQLKSDKPKPKGLFKLLENLSTSEIIFLTCLEPTQQYINLLEKTEFIITKKNENESIVIFNLVDLEKIILNQKNFDQFIKFTEPYQQLEKENLTLKKNIAQKNNSIVQQIEQLKLALNGLEKEKNEITQQLATQHFYSIFAGLSLFFSGFGLHWFYTFLMHK